MKILIVRHADPDYSIDSLTSQGWVEARLLGERLKNVEAAAYYVSPLGRAKDTASFTLKAVGKEATVCPWLQEFRGTAIKPNCPEKESICWDWLPQDWTQIEDFLHYDHWTQPEVFAKSNTVREYQNVITNFDALIEHHGYRRQGLTYVPIAPNNDTIVLFCHFGLECVLLSRLLHISPMILWHGVCAAPSSVTTLATEERRPGVASFRMLSFSDTSHLYVAGEAPSFAGRFRECYTNDWERLD